MMTCPECGAQACRRWLGLPCVRCEEGIYEMPRRTRRMHHYTNQQQPGWFHNIMMNERQAWNPPIRPFTFTNGNW